MFNGYQYIYEGHQEKNQIKDAFKELRSKGWKCKMGGQGYEYLESQYGDNVENLVGYNYEKEKQLFDFGCTYLDWRGDARELVDTLERYGLHPIWNGSEASCIQIFTEYYFMYGRLNKYNIKSYQTIGSWRLK